LAEVGQPYGKFFLFLMALSLVFLVICLLAGYYLNAERLQWFGIIYFAMLVVGFAFMRGVKSEKLDETVSTTIMSLFGIMVIAIIGFSFKQQVMGIFSIQEWPAEAAAPLILQIATFAVSLGVTPQFLLSVMMNIPAPIAEESFFRIGIYNLLAPILGKWFAVVAQAIAFGLFHYFAYQVSVAGIVTASIAGLVLGVVYVKTENQTAIALAHVIYNLLLTVASFR